MEELAKQLGLDLSLVKQFISFETMVVIWMVIEFIKEIVNRVKPIVPKVDLPDKIYPAFSIVIGGLLCLIKELNITPVIGICSGILLTITYKKFESWMNKLGIKK